MPKGKLKARATHFHELQKMDGAYYEHKRKLRLNVEERNKFGSQKHAKVDVIRIQWVIVDLEQSSTKEIEKEVNVSIHHIAAKEPLHEFTQAE